MSNEEYTAGPRPERIERKLAAILSADVQGYSRLMGEDEEATIRTLTAYREVIATLIQQYRGRVVDSPGDNLLAEFASAVDGVCKKVGELVRCREKEISSILAHPLRPDSESPPVFGRLLGGRK